MGTTVADHTVSDSPDADRTRRATTFPQRPGQCRTEGEHEGQRGCRAGAAGSHDDQPGGADGDADEGRPLGVLAEPHERDQHGEDDLGLEHERGQTGRHAEVQRGVEQAELADAHEQPDQGDVDRTRGRAADEEDRRQRHEGEPDRGEGQRWHVADAFVDHDEVDAPDGRGQAGEQRGSEGHASIVGRSDSFRTATISGVIHVAFLHDRPGRPAVADGRRRAWDGRRRGRVARLHAVGGVAADQATRAHPGPGPAGAGRQGSGPHRAGPTAGRRGTPAAGRARGGRVAPGQQRGQAARDDPDGRSCHGDPRDRGSGAGHAGGVGTRPRRQPGRAGSLRRRGPAGVRPSGRRRRAQLGRRAAARAGRSGRTHDRRGRRRRPDQPVQPAVAAKVVDRQGVAGPTMGDHPGRHDLPRLVRADVRGLQPDAHRPLLDSGVRYPCGARRGRLGHRARPATGSRRAARMVSWPCRCTTRCRPGRCLSCGGPRWPPARPCDTSPTPWPHRPQPAR